MIQRIVNLIRSVLMIIFMLLLLGLWDFICNPMRYIHRR